MWDHKIEMKPGFEPKLFKMYNLTPEEQVGKLGKRIYSTVSITHGFPLLFHHEERWQAKALPGLLVFEQLDGQKHLSASPDF